MSASRIARAFTALAIFFLSLTAATAWSADDEETRTILPLDTKKNTETPYVIGPQNVIQIKIFGDASTHQIYRVNELGIIRHTLIGEVRVGGMTVSELENSIESKLKGDYFVDPRVNVFVLEYSTFSIIGEVKRPGNFEITGRVTVIEAISMAGGFTAVANQRGVKIMRKKDGSKSTLPVDTTRITQQGDRSGDVSIEAEDVIVVPKSFF